MLNCMECGSENVYKQGLCEEHYKEMFDGIIVGTATITSTGFQFYQSNPLLHERLVKFKEFSMRREMADDHTRCPSCSDQLYFCDCVAWEAYSILFDLLKN